jgi:hypothetical protein
MEHDSKERIRCSSLSGISVGRGRGRKHVAGRCAIAAEHYASRLVLPSSQQHPSLSGVRVKAAPKALEKLAGPRVPLSLKQLQKGVSKAKADNDAQLREARIAARKARAETYGSEHVDSDVDEHDVDLEGLDNFED